MKKTKKSKPKSKKRWSKVAYTADVVITEVDSGAKYTA